jgi:hypothetical protein
MPKISPVRVATAKAVKMDHGVTLVGSLRLSLK